MDKLPFSDMPEMRRTDNKKDDGYWEEIAKTLEQIEVNTRAPRMFGGGGGGTGAGKGGGTAGNRSYAAGGGGATQGTGGGGAQRSLGGGAPAQHSSPASMGGGTRRTSTAAGRQAAGGGKRETGGEARQKKPASSPSTVKRMGGGKGILIPGSGAGAARASIMPTQGAVMGGGPKSQMEMQRRRQEKLAQEQSKGLVNTLKEHLSKWDGSFAGHDKGDLEDAAGMGAGGPIYKAVKEVKDLVGDIGQDDESLTGILKKTLKDKTGLTALGEKIDRTKQDIQERVVKWAGGVVKKQNADTNAGKRDSKGRFLKKKEDPNIEIAEETLSLAESEAKVEKKRHKELINAVKGIDAGGGLFDGAGNRLLDGLGFGGGKGGGRGGRSKVKMPRGKLFGKAGGLLAGAAGALGLGGLAKWLGGGEDSGADVALDAAEAANTARKGRAAGKAGTTVAEKAGAAAAKKGGGSLLAKGATLGAKGLLAGAKAVPIAGQILAAGMAVYDGFSGWNDNEMHKDAFGLKDGQEATTGQKASAAAANVLDMGGLFTGAASLLGFDVSTSDLASGIYSLFGGGDDEEKKDAATKDAKEAGDSKEGESAKPSTTELETLAQKEEEKGILSDLTDAITALNSFLKGDENGGNGLFFLGGAGGSGGGGGGGGGGGYTAASGAFADRARDISSQGLGGLSAKFESAAAGSSAVAYDRNGGTSYGKYQFSSRKGKMDEFIAWAEKHGGTNGKEVASRLRAAGPLNTGSKHGVAADVWKQLAAEGKLGNMEHEFAKATLFDPAFAKIKSEDLRKRIEGSKALQDVLWSTAVQHGDSGAARLINSTYRDGMSDEELVRNLYAMRGTQFGSSTAQVQQSVRNRFAEEQQIALAMLQNEKNGTAGKPGNPAFGQAPQDAVAATSQALMAGTQDAMNRGVRYGFGSKNSRSGSIDCSGWIAENNRIMFEQVNQQAGREIYSKQAKEVLRRGANGGAAGIIQSVSKATGELLGNADLAPDKVREGMMIGMDTGNKGWDRGRFGGIDHIVQTYRDPTTGRMMVSESTSGKGVTSTDYETWYKRQNARGARMYGTDVTKLADAEQSQQWKDSLVAQKAQEAEVAKQELAAAQEGVVNKDNMTRPEPPAPEPVYDDADPYAVAMFEKMVGFLSDLVDNTKPDNKETKPDNNEPDTPQIPMDYDNDYCRGIAHDRA